MGINKITENVGGGEGSGGWAITYPNSVISSNGGLIYQRIPKIMAEVEPIAKARTNVQQGYKFRGIDDIYAALQMVLAKHEVFTAPRVLSTERSQYTTKTGTMMNSVLIHYRFRFYTSDGSYFEADAIGEGADSGDKASNKAASVAHKYAMLQVFCIPTEEPKDPENDSPPPRENSAPVRKPIAPGVPRQLPPAPEPEKVTPPRDGEIGVGKYARLLPSELTIQQIDSEIAEIFKVKESKGGTLGPKVSKAFDMLQSERALRQSTQGPTMTDEDIPF